MLFIVAVKTEFFPVFAESFHLAIEVCLDRKTFSRVWFEENKRV